MDVRLYILSVWYTTAIFSCQMAFFLHSSMLHICSYFFKVKSMNKSFILYKEKAEVSRTYSESSLKAFTVQ